MNGLGRLSIQCTADHLYSIALGDGQNPGTATEHPHIVYARTAGGQTITRVGQYNDTVVVTVHY